jgi:hypothetical protein
VSSFVNRICYQSENEYVVVLLKRTYYHYCRFPPALVQQWLNASSKGRFYNAYSKGGMIVGLVASQKTEERRLPLSNRRGNILTIHKLQIL